MADREISGRRIPGGEIASGEKFQGGTVMMRSSTSNMVLSFTIGGLLGAGLALIFAPHSGEKTRRKIMDAIDDAKEEISDYAERIKAKLV